MSRESYIKIIICGLLLCIFTNYISAQNYAVSGYLIDADTKETLIGATVYLSDKGTGVITDRYGYFQLAGIPKGEHLLRLSYVGYETLEIKIEIKDKGIALPDIEMKPQSVNIEEVTIAASSISKAADRQIETSMIELTPQMIQSIP
ncbi:MAG: carboxypeptidase-like regulatory domain-containing protein, partial [Bacteroidales bacterium]